MSKDTFTDGLDDLPPPYSPTASTSAQGDPSDPSFLTAHLQNLRAQADIARDVDDSRLLSRISDAVEGLLTSVLAKPRRRQQTPPRVIEAVAVPGEIIAPTWTLSDDGRESGRIARVVRVGTRDEGKGGAGGEKKGGRDADDDDEDSAIRESLSKGFDDWGRWSEDGEDDGEGEGGASWWSDERLARRLAGFLQPIQAPSRSSNAGPSSAAARINEAVSMATRVEEVTLRRENEMGLWESKTGWAIVVRFRM